MFLFTGHLSPTETDGDMLGYDLYSSALADILSEPTMQPPICVGLYAQWGSGKSFLLKKLEGKGCIFTAFINSLVFFVFLFPEVEFYYRLCKLMLSAKLSLLGFYSPLTDDRAI